jgi:hypothetical protein
MSVRLRVSAALMLAVLPVAARAADPESDQAADRIAAVIDRHLAADWDARGIKPAAVADDAEFCRRAYLDVYGRAPKASEAVAFLDDRDPAKRVKLVEKLLGLPSHAGHFAATTRAAWLPQTATNIQFIQFGIQVEAWLRTQYEKNTPADVVVRKLLTTNYRTAGNRGQGIRFVQGDPSDPDGQALAAFYSANEGRPENAGAAVTRLFLGVKLECAQCHDHPFAPYTKEQFWEFAAFFADLNTTPATRPSAVGPMGPQADRNRLTIPNTETVVTAKFFDGTEPNWREDRSPRQELADWVTSPTNAYFARNLVNRTWAHFFGLGIVDPLDEPREDNPPSHPALLDELAREFAAAKFDNRVLIRGIVRSKAYQLSSKMTHPTQADPRRFARMNLKAMTPAQLFDTLVATTGYREPAVFRNNQFAFAGRNGDPRSQFLSRFSSNEKRTETNTTILQALMMMNGQFIGDQTDLERSEVLAAIADMPGWDTNRKVEALFLTALGRRPTPEELERYSSYVDRGGTSGDKKKALADVFWVLLNSPEFLFNH